LLEVYTPNPSEADQIAIGTTFHSLFFVFSFGYCVELLQYRQQLPVLLFVLRTNQQKLSQLFVSEAFDASEFPSGDNDTFIIFRNRGDGMDLAQVNGSS
jgi:hypothetical protein